MAGCCTEFGGALVRSKPLDREAMLDSPLKRNLRLFHIVMYGIGTMIGNSIYGVIAVVSRRYSGPSTFVCFIIAAFIGLLNGMSYSELSAQIPKSGSAFVYTYVIAGEFMAFLAGWLALLEYISTASSAAVLSANTIDVLTNGTLYRLIGEHIGELSSSSSDILNKYPNLLAFGICLFATVLLTCGNDASFMINCILSVVTIVIITIATVFMFTRFDKDNIVSASNDMFLPNGIEGLLSGAGIAFGTFIGFESMTVAGEEVQDPQRAIPRATFLAIGIVGIMTLLYSLSFTGYAPWWEVRANMGLAAVFSKHVIWLRILVSIGTLAAAFCSMLCCLYAITRIVYSMASEGLLFRWLGWIHPKLQVPLVALYVFGVLLGLAAIFFDYAALTSFMSISAVLAYIIVSCDLLVLRFMKPELYPNEVPDSVGYLYEKLQRGKFMRSRGRGFVPCVALACFMVFSAGLLYFCLDAEEGIAKGYAWAIVVLVLLLLSTISCFVLIALHRPFTNWEKGTSIYKVPFVPFVPLICIFLDIAVIIKLPPQSWFRVAIWIAVGIVLYFVYGVWNSSLRETTSGRRTSGHSDISGTNSPLKSESKDTMSSDGKPGIFNSDKVIEANEKTPIVQ